MAWGKNNYLLEGQLRITVIDFQNWTFSIIQHLPHHWDVLPSAIYNDLA